MKNERLQMNPPEDALTRKGHCVVPTQEDFYVHGTPRPLWYLRKKNRRGYVDIKTPNGWMREHRFVMEKFINRKLADFEVVHHIDGDRANNNINNLQLMTKITHTKHHHIGLKRSTETKKNISDSCKNKDYFKHPSYKDILPSDIVDAIHNQRTVDLAAESLGITKRTMYNKMHKFGIKMKGELCTKK